MTITHTNQWNGHSVEIRADIGVMGDCKGQVVLLGKGDTKHDAVQKSLKALSELESSIKDYREKLNAL